MSETICTSFITTIVVVIIGGGFFGSVLLWIKSEFDGFDSGPCPQKKGSIHLRPHAHT